MNFNSRTFLLPDFALAKRNPSKFKKFIGSYPLKFPRALPPCAFYLQSKVLLFYAIINRKSRKKWQGRQEAEVISWPTAAPRQTEDRQDQRHKTPDLRPAIRRRQN
jgi:hypothetical protein